jgi:type II protein arginine methyltransferase
VVGKISPWIDTDASDAALRRDSAAALQLELDWAVHLGLQAVILPPPPSLLKSANYSATLLKVRCAPQCRSIDAASTLPVH